MHGNIYEWCEDMFDREFYSKPEASRPDPIAVKETYWRVFRGGGWDGIEKDCRSAWRSGGR